jgi:antitoxin (DNA-binding transcriptional repressor) of toxin-antitoxin stability system
MWKPWKDKPAEGVAEGMMDNPGDEDSPVAQAIIRRILMQRTDLLAKHGPEKVGAAVDEVADFVGDVEEIGSSDVSGWVKQVEQNLAGMGESMTEASNPEYDDEAGMAKSNLRTMARAVNGLMDTIGDNDNLPEWAQEKIAKAEMMTTSVWDYLLSQKEQGIDPKVENVTKIKEANMESEQGRKNILSILKAVEQGQDAEIMVGGEPITLEYPEARFVGGRYKSFMKAGRQEEFLRALTDARAFDRIMTKMRAVLDKQKNFRGSVPGERGVEEDAPALAKFAGGLGLGVVAAAGAPAIVGILGPLLGIPMAAYGAYSAAKLGMKGVEKLWDMASEKLGGDDKVEQYTQSKIATLPPEQAQAAKAVIKQVAESRRSMAPAVNEGIIDTIKAGAKKAFDKLGGGSDEELLQRLEKETGGKRPEKKDNKKVKESAPPGFDQDLEKKLLKQYKDNPERAYATMWTIHNKQKNENFDQALVNASAQLKENEYFCMLDKQVKLIPEGYKRNSQGFLARK